jgi:cobalt-zinc-cadmium efflux system outer membrane protein
LLVVGLTAQEREISVAFEDLPRLLEQSSPQVQIINAMKDISIAEHDAALQWSNPELNFSHEQIKNGDVLETEQMIYLNKTFTMPWNHWQESRIWQAETRANKLIQKQNMNQLLADTRNSYVRLSLLHNLAHQLTGLKEMLNDLNTAVGVREKEGAISPLKASLLSISLFGLESDILETQQEYHRAVSKWKQILGIDPLQDINLTDTIIFKNIPIDLTQRQQLMDNHPGLQARKTRVDAEDRRITLEKSRILPSISLQGGYKKINPGWEGYVVGLSIPLPLLNWNRAQIEKQKIKHHIQANETTTYKQKLHDEIKNLISSISAKSELLQKNNYGLLNNKIVEDMLAAYREGELSLSEFLNAIQIYRTGSRQYFEQLTAYYRAVFDLEALSGQPLVAF